MTSFSSHFCLIQHIILCSFTNQDHSDFNNLPPTFVILGPTLDLSQEAGGGGGGAFSPLGHI
jgi:hypothetical protein